MRREKVYKIVKLKKESYIRLTQENLVEFLIYLIYTRLMVYA